MRSTTTTSVQNTSFLVSSVRRTEAPRARSKHSGIGIEEVREQVSRIVGMGEDVPTTGQIPFTPRAKKVLELALREALSLGHNHVGTEHMLLGLARENEGVASRILLDFGVDADTIRTAVLETIGGPMPRPRPMVHLRGQRRSRRRQFGPAVFAREMLVVGWLLFGVALGVGVLLGWLIWG